MSGIGVNPNMLATPNIQPPYPQWAPTNTYYVGDVVTYAGQNWVAFFYAANIPSTTNGVGIPPDQYPVTLNTVPGKSSGLYVPIANPPVVANLNGGCWVNLSLATPPAPTWTPTKRYVLGDVVMYPPESPGTYWRCIDASTIAVPPQLPAFQPGSVGIPLEMPPWELLNAASEPVGVPAVGVPPPAPPVIPPLATFTAAVDAQTIVCDWTLAVGAIYTSYVMSITGRPNVVLTDGTLRTYTFTGLNPGTYTVGIQPLYYTYPAPSASVPGLVVGPPGTAPSFTSWDYVNVLPGTLTAGVSDFFFNLGTATTVNIVQNFGTEGEVTLVADAIGTYAQLTDVYGEGFLYPDSIVVVNSANPSLVSAPLSFVYNNSPISVSAFSVTLGNAGDPNTISWTTPAVPTPVSGSPTITAPQFIYHLDVRVNGGTVTSIRIDGLVPGPQGYSDTAGYAEADLVEYFLTPYMTYSIGSVLIQQGGELLSSSGVVPP